MGILGVRVWVWPALSRGSEAGGSAGRWRDLSETGSGTTTKRQFAVVASCFAASQEEGRRTSLWICSSITVPVTGLNWAIFQIFLEKYRALRAADGLYVMASKVRQKHRNTYNIKDQ